MTEVRSLSVLYIITKQVLDFLFSGYICKIGIKWTKINSIEHFVMQSYGTLALIEKLGMRMNV